MLRYTFAIIQIIFVLASSTYAGEKNSLSFLMQDNSSATYRLRHTSSTDIEHIYDEGTINIFDNNSLESFFVITRNGERDNVAEYTLNADSLRLTRHFGTGIENYRLEVDNDKLQLYRDGKLYADTETNLRLDVISDDQRALSITKRPAQILIKPSGRITGDIKGDKLITQFFSAFLAPKTALFGFRFPDNPHEAGDNWSETITLKNADRITLSEGDVIESKIYYRLESVNNENGRRLATVTLDAPLDIANIAATMPAFDDYSNRFEKPIRIRKISRSMKGILIHDLDLNRPVSVDIRVTTEMNILAGTNPPETGKDDTNNNGEEVKPEQGKFTPKPPPSSARIILKLSSHTIYEEKK